MPDYRSSLLPGVMIKKAGAAISGTYSVTTALLQEARIIKFTNNTGQDLTISWDGINDNEFIPSGGFLLLDCSSNAVADGKLSINKGTVFYVKGTAGTDNLYISYYYAS